jgi:hypothetical protein
MEPFQMQCEYWRSLIDEQLFHRFGVNWLSFGFRLACGICMKGKQAINRSEIYMAFIKAYKIQFVYVHMRNESAHGLGEISACARWHLGQLG